MKYNMLWGKFRYNCRNQILYLILLEIFGALPIEAILSLFLSNIIKIIKHI